MLTRKNACSQIQAVVLTRKRKEIEMQLTAPLEIFKILKLTIVQYALKSITASLSL